jgi:hypothetical protein
MRFCIADTFAKALATRLNHHWPHSSLGGLTPAARQSLKQVGSPTPDALATLQNLDYESARLSKYRGTEGSQVKP